MLRSASDLLLQANIIELQKILESGEISSRELVLNALGRIARFDQSGPKINSILESNPEALLIAECHLLLNEKNDKHEEMS